MSNYLTWTRLLEDSSMSRQASLLFVGVETLGELRRLAQGDAVSGVDLVGGDPKSLSHHAAEEVGGKQAVVAGTTGIASARRARRRAARAPGPVCPTGYVHASSLQQPDPREHRGRRSPSRRPTTRPARPGSRCSPTSRPQPRPATGSRPATSTSKSDGNALADERRRERAGRLRDDDQVGAVADRLDDSVRVLRQSGRVVVAGQVRRDGVVASFTQGGLDEVPVPADIAGAVDQHIGRHVLTRRSLAYPICAHRSRAACIAPPSSLQ